MTLEKLHEMGLIKDYMEIYIRNGDFKLLAHGYWYEDNVLNYIHHDLESFTWQDDNEFYADLKNQ